MLLRLLFVVFVCLVMCAPAGAQYPLTANPVFVESGGRTQVSAPGVLGTDLVISYEWEDGDLGGNWWPSTTAQNPIYTAPGNFEADVLDRRLGCWMLVGSGAYVHRDLHIWELPLADTIDVTIIADSLLLLAGANTTLIANATDSQGHEIVSWEWSDNDSGGTFAGEGRFCTYYSPSGTAQADIPIELVATCSEGATGTSSLALRVESAAGAPESFADVTSAYWAEDEIMACARAGIVRGYDDGLYRPDSPITRAELAVYFARAMRLIPPG